ncbi:mitochondrial inner membrane protease ATP23 homolog isoform X2 [Clytia hemisphaerica]|uniref:Mitochondrial inner membrane protease ATP23 n=1 Tax=Clytia hemisphaerica TaxID=252671 RepID=A0A7M5UXA3_9CNID
MPGESEEHQKCTRFAERSCKANRQVKFLLQCLKSKGCEVSLESEGIVCERCEDQLLGGFDPSAKQVVLCQNNLKTQADIDRILSHELIHAFDVCTVKYDVNDTRHLACSEVRASTLSGECSFSREMFNYFPFKIRRQYQECVKRKATNSICASKHLDRDEARKLVEEVFHSCFYDHSPFKEIPRNN